MKEKKVKDIPVFFIEEVTVKPKTIKKKMYNILQQITCQFKKAE